MDQQTNKINIISTNQSTAAIEEIVESYNLWDTNESLTEKAKNGRPLNLSIINELTEKFVGGEIDEKGLVVELQKELGVNAKVAGEIAKELIEKVAPLIQKVTDEQLNSPAFVDEFDRKYFGGPGKQQTPSAELGGAGSGFNGAGDIFPTPSYDGERDGLPQMNNFGMGGSKFDEMPTGHTLPKNIKMPSIPEENVETEMASEAPRRRGRPAKVEPAQAPDISAPKNQNAGPDDYREPI